MDEGEILVREFWPYAQKAARNAMFRWGLDQDDVFQQIMIDVWRDMEAVRKADNPIGYMRSKIRFSVGHCVEDRFKRRGNSLTDQLPEGHDEPAPAVDMDARIDLERGLRGLSYEHLRALCLTWAMGNSAAEAARLAGVAHSTMNERLAGAAQNLAANMGHGVKPQKAYGAVLVATHETGKTVRGGLSAIMKATGLSKGSVANLRSGAREKVNGWSIVA